LTNYVRRAAAQEPGAASATRDARRLFQSAPKMVRRSLMKWSDTVQHVLELLASPGNGVQALASGIPQDVSLEDLTSLWLHMQQPEGAFDPVWTWAREKSLLYCENMQASVGQSLASLAHAVNRAIQVRLLAGLRDDRLVVAADFRQGGIQLYPAGDEE